MILRLLACFLFFTLGACGTAIDTIGATLAGPRRVIPAQAPNQFQCLGDDQHDKFCTDFSVAYNEAAAKDPFTYRLVGGVSLSVPSEEPNKASSRPVDAATDPLPTTALDEESILAVGAIPAVEEPDETSSLKDMLKLGLDYQKEQCSRYLSAVLQSDKTNGVLVDLATKLGATGTALLSVINPSSLETKVVGISTGAIAGADSVYQNDYLFDTENKSQLKITVEQSLTDYKAALLQKLPPDLTFTSAYIELYQAYDQCTWPYIQGLITASLQMQQTGTRVGPLLTLVPTESVINDREVVVSVMNDVAKIKNIKLLAADIKTLDIPLTKNSPTADDYYMAIDNWLSTSAASSALVQKLDVQLKAQEGQ